MAHERDHRADDIPEADRVEQLAPVDTGGSDLADPPPSPGDREAGEADLIEQSQVVEGEDDYPYGPAEDESSGA